MKKGFALILSLCLAAGGILLLVEANTPAMAAGTGSVSVTVKPVMKLVLTLDTTSADFGTDLWVGDTAILTNPIGLSVISSKVWNLTYGASVDVPAELPLSSLMYGTASDLSDGAPFAASGTLLSGQTKTAKTGTTLSYYYGVTVPETALPGSTYTTTVTYTVTQ